MMIDAIIPGHITGSRHAMSPRGLAGTRRAHWNPFASVTCYLTSAQ
jgi:hypothetical protein